jgi:hypothetical protein
MRLSAILVFRRTQQSSEAMGNYASACFGVEPDHGGTTLRDRRAVHSPKHVRGDADLDSRRRILLLQVTNAGRGLADPGCGGLISRPSCRGFTREGRRTSVWSGFLRLRPSPRHSRREELGIPTRASTTTVPPPYLPSFLVTFFCHTIHGAQAHSAYTTRVHTCLCVCMQGLGHVCMCQ